MPQSDHSVLIKKDCTISGITRKRGFKADGRHSGKVFVQHASIVHCEMGNYG